MKTGKACSLCRFGETENIDEHKPGCAISPALKDLEYDFAVVIGRFQPPHRGHFELFERALSLAREVIIVLGSNRSAPNIKNPWTADERQEMIETYYQKESHKGVRLRFVPVRDYYYNDNHWLTEVQEKVRGRTKESKSIILIGRAKDRSTYYLDLFPQWKNAEAGKIMAESTGREINATDIRNAIFSLPTETYNGAHSWLPLKVNEWISQWSRDKTYLHTKYRFNNLQKEWDYYDRYVKQFKTPFPVTFVTTDVVVVKSGHVLLIRRGGNPGRGLLALPGGFLNPDEWIIDCAFRELKEESRINVNKKILKEHVVDQGIFDHPDRSLRGRTITHAFYVKLPDGGELPYVRGSDDAEHALWMPFYDVALNEAQFFEDHVHIIHHFLNK